MQPGRILLNQEINPTLGRRNSDAPAARRITGGYLGTAIAPGRKAYPCEYETICESCPCFSTTIEFLPILQKQKQDAEDKGQTQRLEIFKRLIRSVEQAPVETNTSTIQLLPA